MKNLFQALTVIAILFIIQIRAIAQVSINTDDSNPDSSAMLDVKSTDKGVLVPRMTTAQRNAINSPATSLLVFDTDEGSFYFYSGSSWVSLSSAATAFEYDNANKIVRSDTSTGDIANDDFVFGSLQLGDVGNSDHDQRFFFDKSKAAFRAGDVKDDNWDDINVGNFSVAFGKDTKANGKGALALGRNSVASGDYGFALGDNAQANQNFSVAVGENVTSDAIGAIVFGKSANATGLYATALGFQANASDVGAIAFGYNTDANNTGSVALGYEATSNEGGAVAFGYKVSADGVGSVAVGYENTSNSAFETTVGSFATDYTPNSTTTFDANDRLFTIGNGINGSNRSDAFGILKNGNTYINGTLTIDSTYTFPTNDGTNGQVLATDGNGALSWSSLTGSDNQALSLSGNMLSLVNGGSVDLSGYDNSKTTAIQDSDNDTKIQVEETADEDIIRFDVFGAEAIQISSSPANSSSLSINVTSPGQHVSGMSSPGWQSFKGKGNAKLDKIQLKFYNGFAQGTTYTFSLYKGEGTGGVLLTSTSIPTPTSGGWKTISFPDEIILEKDSMYTIGLSNSAGIIYKEAVNIYNGGRANLGIDDDYFFRVYLFSYQPTTTIHQKLNINNAYTLPTTDGANGELLTTDGSGSLSWTLPTDNDNQTLSLSGNDLSISGGNTLDVSSINTDNQDLSLSGNILSLTNDGTTVDLSGYLDNTDGQTLALSGNDLTISGGNTLDISSINTDNQDLTLSGNSLTLTNDGTPVDLSAYLDNTDGQTLALSGNDLTISGGNTLDISSINTDGQTLALSGNDLTISGGNTLDISSINTDGQTLALSGDNLTISGGNTLNVSALSKNIFDTDGTITGGRKITFDGSNNIFTLKRGNSNDMVIGFQNSGTSYSSAILSPKTGAGNNNGLDFKTKSTNNNVNNVGITMRLTDNGTINLPEYGQGNITGTAAKVIAVESDGDLIEANLADLDDQTLSLSGNTLSLVNGGSVEVTTSFEYDNVHKVVKPSATAGDIANDDFVFGSPQLDDSGDANHDHRFFFDKSKGAFRAGSATSTQWDSTNVGDYSTAFGLKNKANGNYSFSTGHFSTASGEASVAMGDGVTASGQFSIAMGTESLANGIGSFSMGTQNSAYGFRSLALGTSSTANADYSVAIGHGTKTDGENSLALGRSNTAASYAETTLGLFATNYTASSTSAFDANDRLFTIGNGTANLSRSDALVILKNGNTLINGALTIDSAYTLPTADGSNGQVLTTDGSGNVSWVNENQSLSLSSNTLSLTNGGSVDLSSYLDNTDTQSLALSGSDLTISNGNTIDLSSINTNTNIFNTNGSITQERTLTFTGNDQLITLKRSDNNKQQGITFKNSGTFYTSMIVTPADGDGNDWGLDFRTKNTNSGLGSITNTMRLTDNGTVTLPEYGQGNVAGTATKLLGVTGSGQVIEVEPAEEPADRIVYTLDQTPQILNANGWNTSSDFTSPLSVKAGDVVTIRIAFSAEMGSGSGTDNLQFRVISNGGNGCPFSFGGETDILETYDDHRGEAIQTFVQHTFQANCTGTYTFALQTGLDNTDDDVTIDDVQITAVKY